MPQSQIMVDRESPAESENQIKLPWNSTELAEAVPIAYNTREGRDASILSECQTVWIQIRTDVLSVVG